MEGETARKGRSRWPAATGECLRRARVVQAVASRRRAGGRRSRRITTQTPRQMGAAQDRRVSGVERRASGKGWSEVRAGELYKLIPPPGARERRRPRLEWRKGAQRNAFISDYCE